MTEFNYRSVGKLRSECKSCEKLSREKGKVIQTTISAFSPAKSEIVASPTADLTELSTVLTENRTQMQILGQKVIAGADGTKEIVVEAKEELIEIVDEAKEEIKEVLSTQVSDLLKMVKELRGREAKLEEKIRELQLASDESRIKLLEKDHELALQKLRGEHELHSLKISHELVTERIQSLEKDKAVLVETNGLLVKVARPVLELERRSQENFPKLMSEGRVWGTYSLDKGPMVIESDGRGPGLPVVSKAEEYRQALEELDRRRVLEG